MGKNGGKSNLKANSFTALLNLLILSGLENIENIQIDHELSGKSFLSVSFCTIC